MSKASNPHGSACKWVSFDCYGTLVDWNAGFAAILKPIAGERISSLLQSYHRYEPQVEAQRPHRSYRDVLTEVLLRAAKEVGLPMAEVQARILPEGWGLLPVMDDVEDALAALRAEGYKLAVLTNCDEDLFEQTQRCFRRPFDLVITAERVQAYKPSPTHFGSFQQMAGVDRADWIHVANSWFHDIAPARKMGIHCIWLDREGAGKDAAADCMRVSSASELPGAIRLEFQQDVTLKPGLGLIFRFATLEDCRLLAGLNHQLIRDEGHRNLMTIPELEERMREWLSVEYRAVIYEHAGEIVAYALFREQAQEIYLRQLFVVRHKRRCGIGRRAVEILRARVWPRHKRLTVDVLVRNQSALEFWRAVGYQDYALTLEIMPGE